MNNKKVNYMLVSVILLAIGFVVLMGAFYYYHNKPFWETEQIVRKECVIRVGKKEEFGKQKILANDAWGNTLIYQKVLSEDKKFITHTVTSIGPDRLENTGDDISYTCKDYNLSKIVGEWMGEASKEVAKGFLKGVTKESEYDGGDKETLSEKLGKTTKGALDNFKKGWNSGPENKED